MSKPSFKSSHKAVLDSLLLNIPNVLEGKMFGYPAYFVNGKLFACVYGDGVGIKIPAEVTKKVLLEPQVVHFQPLGRSIMKEWIQINHIQSDDYRKDTDIINISIEFVNQLQTTKKKKK